MKRHNRANKISESKKFNKIPKMVKSPILPNTMETKATDAITKIIKDDKLTLEEFVAMCIIRRDNIFVRHQNVTKSLSQIPLGDVIDLIYKWYDERTIK